MMQQRITIDGRLPDIQKFPDGSRVVTYSDRKTYSNKDGLVHRDNGPAEIIFGVTKRWYQNGKLHRLNGPAIVNSDGTFYFWVNGHQMNMTKEMFAMWYEVAYLKEYVESDD